MNGLSDILAYNRSFVENKSYEEFNATKFPDKKMVILTCMDTRLIGLLERAMNLRTGDAKIVKNAGAIVSHPFGSIMRSILVALYELSAEEVYVIGHRDCGMTGLSSESILEKAREQGISQEKIDTLVHAGIDLTEWLKGFSCVEESVADSVAKIKSHPLLPPNTPIHGLVIDPKTGQLDLVVNGYSANRV
ncbi:beta-class carbonic anhydrase [Aneurinibacillus terranovensis]|uniref:beta-class carbonic anhydrase n=1 Tax=Aneurinibacillus terranovensis TaxID=278991 RepID=UPI00040875BA|nr:carbonic anhydrase [Aneurinibacillus terranovensis]